jgi:hypothetical protein
VIEHQAEPTKAEEPEKGRGELEIRMDGGKGGREEGLKWMEGRQR